MMTLRKSEEGREGEGLWHTVSKTFSCFLYNFELY